MKWLESLRPTICVFDELSMQVAMAHRFSVRASIPDHIGKVSAPRSKCLEEMRNLVKSAMVPSIASPPYESLTSGSWVKLICGASFVDVVDIRNLSLVYTLAGVDCIDCAAEESVVRAVHEGIDAARNIMNLRCPWVMISVNDDEDIHFRKAEFDPHDCIPDCSRPCERVCPANAISLSKENNHLQGGVIPERCYGCGRCLPVCPYDKITAVNYLREATAIVELLRSHAIDAIEIHTNGRQIRHFEELWNGLSDSVTNLKLVAVSLPFSGDSTVSSMFALHSVMKAQLQCLNLWQLDGRSMSGDIGRGATRESISFAAHVAASKERPPGFFQLAGGSNAYTVDMLRREGLFKTQLATDAKPFIGGVGFGGYARKIVGRVLRSMPSENGASRIEDHPLHLLAALRYAIDLVGTVKGYSPYL